MAANDEVAARRVSDQIAVEEEIQHRVTARPAASANANAEAVETLRLASAELSALRAGSARA